MELPRFNPGRTSWPATSRLATTSAKRPSGGRLTGLRPRSPPGNKDCRAARGKGGFDCWCSWLFPLQRQPPLRDVTSARRCLPGAVCDGLRAPRGDPLRHRGRQLGQAASRPSRWTAANAAARPIQRPGGTGRLRRPANRAEHTKAHRQAADAADPHRYSARQRGRSNRPRHRRKTDPPSAPWQPCVAGAAAVARFRGALTDANNSYRRADARASDPRKHSTYAEVGSAADAALLHEIRPNVVA